MKLIIRIIYCNSSKLKSFGDKTGYERVSAEFLMGRNYVKRFLNYISNSIYDCSFARVYQGNILIGYDVYLDYNIKERDNI